MSWYIAFIVLRVLVTVFFLLTSTYSVLNYTPFVFYQFLRPRVFGWVNQFVAWHHVWYCVAYLLSVVTLLPTLRRATPGDRTKLRARRLALAYVVVFGLVAEWLVVTPYLPKLWNDGRSLVAAIVSFVPLLWLAAIDHLATPSFDRPDGADGQAEDVAGGTVTDQRRLLAACLVTASYLWIVHLLHASLRASAEPGTPGWVTSLWALALNFTAALVGYAVLNAMIALAAATRAPRAWEYALSVVLAAAATTAVLLAIVFPNIAFGAYAPIAVALVAGPTLALVWSGVALRHPASSRTGSLTGLDRLIAPLVPPGAPSVLHYVGVIATPGVSLLLLGAVERTDWNFLIQKLLVLVEWAFVFGFALAVCRRMARAPWSAIRAAVPPCLAVASLVVLARASQSPPGRTGDPRMEVEVVLDRYAAADLSFKLLYDGLIRHPGRDAQFYRYLQVNTNVGRDRPLIPPDVHFSENLRQSSGPRPHIFLFVLDSFRRDYMSPFNPAVTFTPQIAQFASESFAFQNAFSHYGGTSLAVPSIWEGGLVIHRTSMPEFVRSNALEKLVDAEGYRWFMSLDSVMAPLLAPHPDLVELDHDRRVMDFDMCHTLEDLEDKLDRQDDARPAFAFSLPQNLHISIRQHARVPPGEHYPGFFEPYAAEVHRIDSCFGEFVQYLKRHRLYDQSIVILTTDHGDSLGEAGNWGHGVTIHPEVVRIPLIIHIPERLKATVTTDLTRIAFSTDIVPSLYQLLGHSPRDLGASFGAPLFVPRATELRPRRRESFLVVSSYAATYGLLRRNGRSLYISDLVNGREYAYDLTPQPIGVRTQVTSDMRSINQRLIREQIAGLAALYHFNPEQ